MEVKWHNGVHGHRERMLGYIAAQKQETWGKFIEFFNYLEVLQRPPIRIIELGTGAGTITLIMGLYLYNKIGLSTVNHDDIDTVYSFDKNPENHTEPHILNLLRFLKIDLNYETDILETPENIQRVRDLIAHPGITLLLCDNGSKRKEFNLYADSLKPNDIIMLHDYSKNEETWHLLIEGHIWGTCESQYRDIEEACNRNNLEPYREDLFQNVAWGCFIKRE